MVDLRTADSDGWGGLGRDTVAKASHVALWSCDLEVVAGVRLEVCDDCLFQTSVYLYLLSVILHLEDWRGKKRFFICRMLTITEWSLTTPFELFYFFQVILDMKF